MQRLGGLGTAGNGLENHADAEINMMPLIDMIFILLIFFLVTASFVRESGIEVNRPEAVTAVKKEAVGMVVGIAGDGRVFIDHQVVDVRRVRGLVEIFLAENVDGGIIIDADSACTAGRMVAVLDQCRMAGAQNIAVSARRPGE
ncbi:biopolymer transport membrane protein, TolR-related protein [Syntrophotalea carbinolica DSM 2380]|uniref:Biopolymer transport membrane protein, TolR-related protein n=1 Tax=Syntrophotalea carbinolica (strain DSM 2380 / NBRC 103641 / GraBd1) TaxID=338963 RepID=Q3A6A5_SYNC1|nr:biopolymer transporter ExbD [Syntrophotalea carbinolica]ABA88102.1 biopolymer transport membrane protein, TolR-related protein [Syntrophotalea carbinolica DSM 2380]